MAQAWGAIQNFLGAIMNAVYKVIPSYGLAIIVLTILVRIVLIPLTVKQIRSMSAMQRLQPELKRIQAKYKGDRQKMNEELMKLYREHGVNPLGGCFPLLMQLPVFIALYSVLRAAIPAPAVPVNSTVTLDQLPAARTICVPAESTATSTIINCRIESKDGKSAAEEKSIEVKRVDNGGPLPSYVTLCPPGNLKLPDGKTVVGFGCHSPLGTGHLPRRGDQFEKGSLGAAIVSDKATFLGMHLTCTPFQAASKTRIRLCTAASNAAGGASLVAYFTLVALMMASTYYQQKQMAGQATGPQAKQMQMMGRIMPLFLGYISLNIPAGVIIYWIVSNGWTIGQQTFFLKRQPSSAPTPSAEPPDKGKGQPPGKGKGQPPGKGKGQPPAKPKPKK